MLLSIGNNSQETLTVAATQVLSSNKSHPLDSLIDFTGSNLAC